MFWRRCSVMLAVLAVASCASAPTASDFDRATLHGVVYGSDGLPVEWVEVSASDGPPVCSDIGGRFALPNVRQGPIVVRARRQGYEPAEVHAVFADRTQVLYLRLRSARDVMTEAQELLDAGLVAAACDAADRAVRLDPSLEPARYLAAIAHLRNGDAATAFDRLEPLANRASPAVTLLDERIAERRRHDDRPSERP
ncbi:MAG: carboxypeptidase-like regulatory domain-containing protein [bacterium]